MPSISPVQTETVYESAAAKPPRSDDSLAFAKMLAATVQNQAQSSLASIAAPVGTNAPADFAPADTRFAQLAFLNQPANLALPSFVANRWQPSQPPAAVGVASQTGTANPFTPATKSGGIAGAGTVTQTVAVNGITGPQKLGKPTDFSAFPRPINDNGRGIHWIPTPYQAPDVVDKYVGEAQEMGIKWVTLLNDGVNKSDNNYLVDKLIGAGIEPVMRLYTDGGAPLDGDVQAAVRHYAAKGVNYFQLYNEPNLRIENQGQAPDTKAYAAKWLNDARKVVAAGGLPGFASLSPTPGLAPGAAPGDMDDLKFLRESLQEVVRLGGQDVLDKTWLSVHNYGEAHLRVRDYDKVVRDVLGQASTPATPSPRPRPPRLWPTPTAICPSGRITTLPTPIGSSPMIPARATPTLPGTTRRSFARTDAARL